MQRRAINNRIFGSSFLDFLLLVTKLRRRPISHLMSLLHSHPANIYVRKALIPCLSPNSHSSICKSYVMVWEGSTDDNWHSGWRMLIQNRNRLFSKAPPLLRLKASSSALWWRLRSFEYTRLRNASSRRVRLCTWRSPEAPYLDDSNQYPKADSDFWPSWFLEAFFVPIVAFKVVLAVDY